MSEPYEPHNLLDRRARPEVLQLHYDHEHRREHELLAGRLPAGGRVLSIGCGPDPGRHLFPRPGWHMTGVDIDPAVLGSDELDDAVEGRAGRLALEPASFDAVLCRLVLHHVVYREPLAPVFEEAARLLRPGGLLIAVEPGLWHPVGAGLALANRVGLGVRVHGTPDDVPLSPRALMAEARAAGLQPELHSVTFSWRRLPPRLQLLCQRLDALGSRPRLAPLGHTLMLIARRYSTIGMPNSRSSNGSPAGVQPSRS
jgi:SAM-dependent methyltransferase